jgi:hypothetical protein
MLNSNNYPGCKVHTCPPDGRRGSRFPDEIGINYFAFLILICQTAGRREPLNPEPLNP